MREENRKRPSANKTDCRRSEVDVLGTIEHRYYSTEVWDCKWGDEMRAFEIINSIRSTEGNGSRYERMRKALICDISDNLHRVGLRRLAQIHDYVELKTEEEERDIRRELMGED